MNPIEIVEKIVAVKDEIREIKLKLEHHQRCLDHIADDLIEYLKYKKLIESRIV